MSLANAHKVFRNQTSYNRFWDGRNHLTVIITSVRNLTRSFLLCSHPTSATDPTPSASPADRAETERVVRILIAILYATKNHLRAEWGSAIIPGTAVSKSTGDATMKPEYSELLPKGLEGADDKGLGLPLQLTFFVEQYIQRCFDKGFFHAPQASQMQVQLNTLVHAYGMMETIRLTPIPVAHLYIILPVLVPNPAPTLKPLQHPPKTSPRPIRLRPPLRPRQRNGLVGRPHRRPRHLHPLRHRRHRLTARRPFWLRPQRYQDGFYRRGY